ncbi:MAG: Hsp20/alpha crystallin family protein, partial [Nitrospira sp.]
MTSYLPSGMSTIRSDAFDRQVDRLFNEALRAFAGADQTGGPASNAWEDDNGFYIQMALPGWEPKDITLEVNNQVLTVKGVGTVEQQNTARFHLREIADGQFTRLFRLPSF